MVPPLHKILDQVRAKNKAGYSGQGMVHSSASPPTPGKKGRGSEQAGKPWRRLAVYHNIGRAPWRGAPSIAMCGMRTGNRGGGLPGGKLHCTGACQ